MNLAIKWTNSRRKTVTLSIVLLVVGTITLFNQFGTEGFVVLGKVLLAFFPVLVAIAWFRERKNYFS